MAGINSDRLFCVGLSHHTTDLSLREKIHIRPSALSSSLDRFREATRISEAVILSTCNRFEIYGLNFQEGAMRWIAGLAPDASKEVSSRLVSWEQKESVEHLFSVAGGLEAQILGENQILGQVKEAYEISKQAGMTGQTLNMLFQRALMVGKRIRTETRLSETPVSVSSVAVRLCEKIFGTLAGRVVLVVGAGEISSLAAERLADLGARLSVFSTRGRDSAEILARAVSAACYPMETLESHLPTADVVFSGSGAPHIVLPEPVIRAAQKKRGGRPLFLVDLAVPRDIDPSASGLENVFLYNLDDLDGIAAEHRREREKEIPRCRKIIEEETDAFWNRMSDTAHEETLQRFHLKISEVVGQELQRSGVGGEMLDSLKKSIPNRILSEAFKRSREEFAAQERQTLLKALKEFFGL